MWIAFLLAAIVVTIPVGISVRTVWALAHRLGAVDARALAPLLEESPAELGFRRLRQLQTWLAIHASGSVPARVLDGVFDEAPSEGALVHAQTIRLQENSSDVERAVEGDSRVPRVSAALSTTSGMLAAALVVRAGLGSPMQEGADIVAQSSTVVQNALSLVVLSVVAGLTCAALHRAARQERRSRLLELDVFCEAASAVVEAHARAHHARTLLHDQDQV